MLSFSSRMQPSQITVFTPFFLIFSIVTSFWRSEILRVRRNFTVSTYLRQRNERRNRTCKILVRLLLLTFCLVNQQRYICNYRLRIVNYNIVKSTILDNINFYKFTFVM